MVISHDISSLIFSIDYDQTLLSFDASDNNEDGIPDTITFDLPSAFDASITYSDEDTDGELDFFIADLFTPLSVLPDGIIAYVTFDVADAPNNTEAAVKFSQAPAASFGSTTGQSIPGTTDDGSVLITQGFEIYLPNILRRE